LKLVLFFQFLFAKSCDIDKKDYSNFGTITFSTPQKNEAKKLIIFIIIFNNCLLLIYAY